MVSVHIVVARYKEDLQWLVKLAPLAHDHHWQVTFHIYNKDPDTRSHVEAVQRELLIFAEGAHIVELNNLGRESDTYLRHILAQYDSVTSYQTPTYWVFLQGRIEDHIRRTYRCSDQADFVVGQVRDAMDHGVSMSTAKAHDIGIHSATRSFRLRLWDHKDQEGMTKCLGDWFEDRFEYPFPDQAKWWTGALFCVDASRIMRRPRAFYEACLADVQYPCPEAGHFLERVWLYMFM
jgi:hypothetical protein